MKYAPVIGQHIIVAEKANWYNGREAVVTEINDFGVFDTVYSVAVGNVHFCLRREHMKEIQYQD